MPDIFFDAHRVQQNEQADRQTDTVFDSVSRILRRIEFNIQG